MDTMGTDRQDGRREGCDAEAFPSHPAHPSHPVHPVNPVPAIAERLTARGETLAVAESAAGGLVCLRITAQPGSSAWFLGGVVAYSNLAKERWLGIGAEALRATGAVSPAAALALARAVREALGATWGAAETGIAGPQVGRRSAKPAGLAYLAVVGDVGGRPVERVVERSTGLDDRRANQEAFAEALLQLLLESVIGLPD